MIECDVEPLTRAHGARAKQADEDERETQIPSPLHGYAAMRYS